MEGCVLGAPHDGLQQRSEWPRILHSAVHAHSPNIKKKGSTIITEIGMPPFSERQKGSGWLKRKTCMKMNDSDSRFERNIASYKAT